MNYPKIVKIETQADQHFLRPLNSLVRALLLLAPGLGKQTAVVNDLELAFNEAYANIVEHAYGATNKGPIIIEITLSEEAVEFKFEDFGKEFDYSLVPEPNFERPANGGLGVWLIRRFMDECVYSRENGKKNVLRLIKKIPAADL